MLNTVLKYLPWTRFVFGGKKRKGQQLTLCLIFPFSAFMAITISSRLRTVSPPVREGWADRNLLFFIPANWMVFQAPSPLPKSQQYSPEGSRCLSCIDSNKNCFIFKFTDILHDITSAHFPQYPTELFSFKFFYQAACGILVR